MKPALVALTAALLLFAIPGPAAASDAAPFCQDKTGDVSVGEQSSAPSAATGMLDLVGLTATTSPEGVAFQLQVADTSASNPATGSITYLVRFAVGGVSYEARIVRFVSVYGPVPDYSGQFRVYDQALGDYRALHDLKPTEAANVIAWTLPLDDLKDGQGVPPVQGTQLTDLTVESLLNFQESTPPPPVGSPPPAVFSDRMPDADACAYELKVPTDPSKALLFTSPQPARASNGAAATFLYPIVVANQGAAPRDVILQFGPLPAGWSGVMLDQAFSLAPGETRQTYAVVQTAFAHQHGSVVNFTARATDDRGADEAAPLGLQLVYTATPQPAGHHPVLFFHSLDRQDAVGNAQEKALGYTARDLFMNTLQDDDKDSGLPVNPDSSDTWTIPLSPDLGMGLSFDVQGTGVLHTKLKSTSSTTLPGVQLAGHLVARTTTSDVELGSFSADKAYDVGGETPVELKFTPSKDAGTVPYKASQNLVAVITETHAPVTGDFGRTTLDWVGGGYLTLPLLEYQDAVPSTAVVGFHTAVDKNPQYVNPGRTTQFHIKLGNAGGQPVEVRVQQLAANGGQTVTFPTDKATVAPGGSEDLAVLVQAPANVTQGDQLTTYVVLHLGTGRSALVTLSSIVDQSHDIPDAAAVAPHKSPGVPFGVGVAALVGLAALARRGRAKGK